MGTRYLLCFLRKWSSIVDKKFPFAVPMTSREQTYHLPSYYFCITKTTGLTPKTRKIYSRYPNLTAAIRPLGNFCSSRSYATRDIWRMGWRQFYDSAHSIDPGFIPVNATEQHLITQAQLNDLGRYLNLSKRKAELLGSTNCFVQRNYVLFKKN